VGEGGRGDEGASLISIDFVYQPRHLNGYTHIICVSASLGVSARGRIPHQPGMITLVTIAGEKYS